MAAAILKGASRKDRGFGKALSSPVPAAENIDVDADGKIKGLF